VRELYRINDTMKLLNLFGLTLRFSKENGPGSPSSAGIKLLNFVEYSLYFIFIVYGFFTRMIKNNR